MQMCLVGCGIVLQCLPLLGLDGTIQTSFAHNFAQSNSMVVGRKATTNQGENL